MSATVTIRTHHVGEPWNAPPLDWNTQAPVLMCATDDRYAMPLAAALASVALHLDAKDSTPLQLVLLDGGMAPDTWGKLNATLRELRLATIRIVADRQAVGHLNVSHHISHTAYFRLLSSEWLPDWITRVVYLDCDVIVQADVRELWAESIAKSESTVGNQCEVWAVPDIACPFLDARRHDECQDFVAYFASLKPVPNYSDLGLDPNGLYFNSGVMVLDLAAWRRNDRSRDLIHCLETNRRHVWCWDQYALNVVFAERWGNLPLAWNFGAHAYDYLAVPSLKGKSPLRPQEYNAMWDSPKLIHFTTEIKPWHYYSFHPLTQRFFEYLDRTAWAGWRPTKPGFSVWWHVQTFRWQKHLMAWTRRWQRSPAPATRHVTNQ